ncbi:MAG TPA: HAD family hydrolase [Hydrogenispora sp.]|jgi:phosphoglycolate phosphatase|nr:HAD family hydrolase [Hydrogenispora sp.]
MPMFKGVIFDLDGTLLDTIADMSSSVNQVLAALGYPQFSCAEYKQKIGRGFRNLLERSLPEEHRTDEEISAALKRFLEIYDQNYMNETVPYEGIPEVLNHLVEKGVKMGVNSNKRTDYTNNLIRKFFPDIEFVGVFGERAGVPKKPHPQSALEILERMELAANEVIYIGDSGTDIQTGKNAGMATAGVLWGFRTSAELEENGADYILRTPQEIITLF